MPGCLPWMSSCAGPVTIASAMSGTVSDTRTICVPTFRIVDRPTSRSTEELSEGAITAPPPPKPGAGACRAWGAATRITMMKPARAGMNLCTRGVIAPPSSKCFDYLMTSEARLSPRIISTVGAGGAAGAEAGVCGRVTIGPPVFGR